MTSQAAIEAVEARLGGDCGGLCRVESLVEELRRPGSASAGPALDKVEAFAAAHPGWVISLERGASCYGGAAFEHIADRARAAVFERVLRPPGNRLEEALSADCLYAWGFRHEPCGIAGWAKIYAGGCCSEAELVQEHAGPGPLLWSCGGCGSKHDPDFRFAVSEQTLTLREDPLFSVHAIPSPESLAETFVESFQKTLARWEAESLAAVGECRRALKRLAEPGLWKKAAKNWYKDPRLPTFAEVVSRAERAFASAGSSPPITGSQRTAPARTPRPTTGLGYPGEGPKPQCSP